jgi:hypothetical protein
MTKKATKKELARIRKELRDPLTVARHQAQLLDPQPRYRP